MKKISLLLIGVITALCLVGWVGFTLAVLTGRSDKTEPDSSMTVDDTGDLIDDGEFETETITDAETYDDNEAVLYY